MTAIFLCSLQDKLSQCSPTEESVESEVLVQIEQNDVQSAPSEFNTLEIQVSDYSCSRVGPCSVS